MMTVLPVYKLSEAERISLKKEDASVLFDEDLKIAAIFEFSGVRKCILPTKPSLWLVCVHKKTHDAFFYEFVTGSIKEGFKYKQSHAHPGMIGRELLKRDALEAFKQLEGSGDE